LKNTGQAYHFIFKAAIIISTFFFNYQILVSYLFKVGDCVVGVAIFSIFLRKSQVYYNKIS
jgi:hypothetical protein